MPGERLAAALKRYRARYRKASSKRERGEVLTEFAGPYGGACVAAGSCRLSLLGSRRLVRSIPFQYADHGIDPHGSPRDIA